MAKPENSFRTVSAISVIDLANELIERTSLEKTYLETLGEEFRAIHNAWLNNDAIQEKRLPEQLLIQLWHDAKQSGCDDSLGLDIGNKVNHSAKGLLANWIFQCESLAESFDTFSQNIHLLNPSEQWHKVDEGEMIKLVFQFEEDYPDIAVDRSLATIISWSSALSGKAITPVQARFKRSKPADLAIFNKIFGQDLVFNQAENCLTFSKNVFYHPTESNNPYLKDLLKEKATELSLTLKSKQSVKAAVEKLLYLDLAKFCQIDASCKALHLSRSTLYRKLKAEKTNFTDLVKISRINRAKQMELNDASAEEIADELGFQDVGSFYRFRKTF